MIRKNKHRIHLIHYSSNPGGIEVLIPMMIQKIPNYQFSAFVIRKPNKKQPNVYKNASIPIYYGSSIKLLSFIKVLIFCIKNTNNIYHAFNIGPVYLLLLRIVGIRKLIYSIHGTKYWKNRNQKIILKNIWKIAMDRRFIITSNSIFSGNVFNSEVIQNCKIKLLYNPFQISLFYPYEKKNKDTKLNKIIYVGRLTKGKNLYRWIDLASFLSNNFKELIFEIYGDGPEREKLKNYIDKNKQTDNILLKGYVNNPWEVYRKADVFIYLSEYESFGNVVIESILCGTPVIVSDIPSMKEIFCDFPEFLVKNDENLDKNVLNKFKHLKKLNISAAMARKSFIKRFREENYYEKLNILYDSFKD